MVGVLRSRVMREFLEQGVELGFAPPPVRLDDLEHGADVLLDVEAAEDRGFLREIADAEPRALIHRQRGDIPAVEMDVAAIGLDEAGDHVEHRRLAGPVGPEQADGFAAPDVEAHPAHNLAAAEALLDAMDGEIVAIGGSGGLCLWAPRARLARGGAARAVRPRLHGRSRRCWGFAASVPTFEQGNQIDHKGLEPIRAAPG